MGTTNRKIINKFKKYPKKHGYWYLLECLFCKKTFELSGYKFNGGAGKFCSKRCYGDAKIGMPGKSYPHNFVMDYSFRKTGGNVKCLICDKHFYVSLGKKEKRKYCSQKCMKVGYQNEGNPSWKGGSSKNRRTLRQNKQHLAIYKEWRESVFNKDNYTCRTCRKRGGILHADHIKMWALYPKLRFEIDNGQTLCKECHQLKTKEDFINYNKSRNPLWDTISIFK